MREITELYGNIAASLYIKPATLDELMERDFLKNYADSSIDRILMRLENKKWIFINKHGKHQTYKAIARKELAEWELVL